MAFNGNWNAATNSPYLVNGTGNVGDCYIVSVAGTQFLGSYTGSYIVGEYIIYQGGQWLQSRLQNIPLCGLFTASPVNYPGPLAKRPIQISDLPYSSVTPGSYTNTNITVDQYGRIIAASNGSGGGGSGTVTSIATTAPILGGTITTTGTISISQATISTDGYLSSTDWNTFNNKQSAITTGTTAQYFRGDLSLATFPSIPFVGTWGALNYPTWVSGAPFVKMTAAGTFALDTTVYGIGTVTSIGVSTNATYLTVTSSPVTSSGTITVNKTTGLTANQVVATPNGTTGTADLRSLVVADLPTSIQQGALIFDADGMGTVISSIATFWVRPTFAGTLTNWYMDADQNGTVTMTVKKNGSDMIGSGNAPALSANNNQNAAISGWTTTTFSAGDLITFGVISPATLTKLACTLKLTKS